MSPNVTLKTTIRGSPLKMEREEEVDQRRDGVTQLHIMAVEWDDVWTQTVTVDVRNFATTHTDNVQYGKTTTGNNYDCRHLQREKKS